MNNVVCSFCGKALGHKAGLASGQTSHGMCPECADHFRRMWEGMSLGEYLDQFEVPVLVVDADARVVAGNQALAAALGKSERQTCGLLGGQAMACVHSRLPEGCGKTVHCKTCTVRNTVEAALEAGKPQLQVPAYLESEQGGVDLLIPAIPRENLVHVAIHRMEPSAKQPA